jgi:hypothetical protein
MTAGQAPGPEAVARTTAWKFRATMRFRSWWRTPGGTVACLRSLTGPAPGLARIQLLPLSCDTKLVAWIGTCGGAKHMVGRDTGTAKSGDGTLRRSCDGPAVGLFAAAANRLCPWSGHHLAHRKARLATLGLRTLAVVLRWSCSGPAANRLCPWSGHHLAHRKARLATLGLRPARARPEGSFLGRPPGGGMFLTNVLTDVHRNSVLLTFISIPYSGEFSLALVGNFRWTDGEFSQGTGEFSQ